MMRVLRASLGIGALLLAIVGLASAEPPQPTVPPTAPAADEDDPPDVAPKEVGAPAGKSRPGNTLKDPTSPSAKMRDVLTTKATPGGAAPRVSPLALRGRVIARDKPAAALLEVDGKLYTIGKGSVLAGPNNTTIRVLDISSTEVRIQFDPLKEIVVLR